MEAARASVRLGYAASDVAGQLVFAFVSFYLLYFYTEVCGIPAATAGTILLAARLIDALDVPVWGLIFDRTRSRWGRCRPWFLRLCGPFAFSGVLVFAAPQLAPGAAVPVAAFTYVVCSILYTGINTPVTAILPALTDDPRERVVLTCWRMVGSKLGVLIVNLAALPLVARLGGGDPGRGFMLAVPVFAAGSVALYLFAFRRLSEREVVAAAPPVPLRRAWAALRGNWPWFIVFGSSLCFWIAFVARISALPYLLEHGLHRKDLIGPANALDFLSLGPVLLLPWFCRRASKRTVWALGLGGMLLGQGIMAWGLGGVPSVAVVLTGWAVGFAASGVAMAMPFALLADAVDYGEWRTGVRAAGLLTALGAAFCLKAGSGLGGALPAWLMSATGYVAGAAQTSAALQGIVVSVVWLPALFLGLALLPVLGYGRFERQEERIRRELADRSCGVACAAGPVA